MKKNLTSVIIFILSGIILALGIWQLILYIPPQLEMLDNAVLQGATSEQTSDYYWHDFIPQVLTYVITTLGFTAVLLTAGMLHLRLAANQPVITSYSIHYTKLYDSCSASTTSNPSKKSSSSSSAEALDWNGLVI